MRINEHNLDSLRKIIRDLQQENDSLKTLLSEHNIPYEDRNVLEEQSVPDEYDEDQGARILPHDPTEDDAKEFTGNMNVQSNRQHIGIRNVRERIEKMCGGILTVESRVGEGTAVTTHILNI